MVDGRCVRNQVHRQPNIESGRPLRVHYVSVSNTTGSSITITLPNPAPVDGQQFYIKAANITNPIVISSAGSGTIVGNNGVPFSTLTMSLGEVIFLVWSAAENQWLAVNASSAALSGDISVGFISAAGVITATDTGLINPDSGRVATAGTGGIITGTGLKSTGGITAGGVIRAQGRIEADGGCNCNGGLTVYGPLGPCSEHRGSRRVAWLMPPLV